VEPLILTVIIGGSLALFISRIVPYEITAILIIAALAISGILSPADALLGFSSTATITIAAMFVIGAGLGRTGAVDALASGLARHAPASYAKLLLMLAGIVGFSSAFVNNTPVVVIMVPVLLSICRKGSVPASRLFLPLSYFAILGGTCTLIGTSTNILIDDLFRKAGGPGFHIFAFAPVGVLYLAIGVLAVVLLARHTLPERASLASLMPAERKARFVTELVLTAETPLAGRRVEEIFKPGGPVRLLEVIRGEEIILAMRARDEQLQVDDALIVEGSPQEISAFLSQSTGVELASVVEDEQRVPMKTLQLKLVEAVVLPDSPLRRQGHGRATPRPATPVPDPRDAPARWGRHAAPGR
jgi:di/tricarboxylate transporter